MKKILLPLFFITASMRTIQLSAYCFYNHSKDKAVDIRIYSSKERSEKFPSTTLARHKLKPGGSKGCWHWESIAKNPKKELYWIAYERGLSEDPFSSKKLLGKGYFPIGSYIYFWGWGARRGDIVDIRYNREKWKYGEPPWNYKKQPWKTYKH